MSIRAGRPPLLERVPARSSLIATTLLIAGLTLYPFKFSFDAAQWAHLLVWYPHEGIRDVINNLLLFFPFGVTGFFAFLKRHRSVRASLVTLVMGTCLSMVIETVQAFDLGRDSSVNDIILNGCGTGLGALVAYAVLRMHSTPEILLGSLVRRRCCPYWRRP